MFTATKLGESTNRQTGRRTVTVRFSDGNSEFDKDFSFAIKTPIEEMKKTVKRELDVLNEDVEPITGSITDVPDEVPVEPTAAELAKTEWEANLAKLKQIQELIDLGVLTGNETPVKNLQAKVKADFKQGYIN